MKSPGQHGDLTERADRGGIAICECGLRISDCGLWSADLGFLISKATIQHLTPHTADARARYMLLLTTETRRAQRKLYFLPARETAIGQKIAALRARSSNPVVCCQRLELG